MSGEELDAFLDQERVCRVASLGTDGPHVAPLWFVWDGHDLWLNSTFRSQRWRDVERDPRISVVVDDGVEFTELRGAELSGSAAVASEVPRTSEPRPDLAAVEERYARKYLGTPTFVPDGRHAWLRLTPTRIVSWDFRKNTALRPRRGQP